MVLRDDLVVAGSIPAAPLIEPKLDEGWGNLMGSRLGASLRRRATLSAAHLWYDVSRFFFKTIYQRKRGGLLPCLLPKAEEGGVRAKLRRAACDG